MLISPRQCISEAAQEVHGWDREGTGLEQTMEGHQADLLWRHGPSISSSVTIVWLFQSYVQQLSGNMKPTRKLEPLCPGERVCLVALQMDVRNESNNSPCMSWWARKS